MGLHCSEPPCRGWLQCRGGWVCEIGHSLSSLSSQTFPSVGWESWSCSSQPHCPFVVSAASPLGAVSPHCLSKVCSWTTESSLFYSFLPLLSRTLSWIPPQDLTASMLPLFREDCSSILVCHRFSHGEELPHSSLSAHTFSIFITKFPVIQISSGSFIRGTWLSGSIRFTGRLNLKGLFQQKSFCDSCWYM